MSGKTFFQIFIFVDVFLVGALVAVAARHAYAHFRPSKPVTEDPEKPHLPVKLKEQMLHESEEKFEHVLTKSVDQLQHDLHATSEQINELMKRFAGEIIGEELERYRAELTRLHHQAEVDLGTIRQEVSGHEAELKTQLAKEIELEKQGLIKLIDTRLSDAVGSFLLETLGHNVDLGNQEAYLVAMLEAHKEDFKKEVAGDGNGV
jgi:hypothetical protein